MSMFPKNCPGSLVKTGTREEINPFFLFKRKGREPKDTPIPFLSTDRKISLLLSREGSNRRKLRHVIRKWSYTCSIIVTFLFHFVQFGMTK